MASTDTWLTPLVRYRMNQDSLKQDMRDVQEEDIELGYFDDIDADFGVTLKDTITAVNYEDFRTRRKKTVLVLSDDQSQLRLPRFLKIRVYWARLLGW
ncbi:hypothetical protein PITC_032050 [Penicillium italicum]|uniref:Uncharacterized protein n=1 Tax=Penicillium italicum TaxID=40296 RepID=A0A0A2L4D5_PENIT|nr:hypothetical protein PITC_032050 [Penicillium italicum]